MDNWTEANLLAMLLGGNRQLRSFFRRQKIENSEVEVLYRTKQATYYREQLGAQGERMLDKRRAARPAFCIQADDGRRVFGLSGWILVSDQSLVVRFASCNQFSVASCVVRMSSIHN